MNQAVIEAQARYLIEDRIHATHRTQSPKFVVTIAGCAF